MTDPSVAPVPPSATPPNAVSLRGLHKRFDQKIAVESVDLDVPAGTFYGLVGPNGAGKSTTLKMTTGLLRPDGGSATVDGIDVWSDPKELKSRIGVVGEDLRLFERLTGREMLHYVALLRGFERQEADHRGQQLLHFLGLEEASGRLVIDYSAGMRKKIALGAAVLHRPRVLFLDEPFESVDPLSVRLIRDLLEQLVAGGATVVFSSHVMEVVERLCDHVAVMHQGRVVAQGVTAELCDGRRLEDVFVDTVGVIDAPVDLDWLTP